MPGLFEIVLYIFVAVSGTTMMFSMSKMFRQIHIVAILVLSLISFINGYIGAGIVCIGLLGGSVLMLTKILASDNLFSILQVRGSNEYLGAFIEYYKKEIYHFSPYYKRNPESTCFLILNKIEVAGVFIVTVQDKKTLYIDLDFVISRYRDLTVGKYLFIENIKYFKDLGYESIRTVCLNETHKTYLLKMGFIESDINGERLYVKDIV